MVDKEPNSQVDSSAQTDPQSQIPDEVEQDLTALYEHVQKAVEERDQLKDQLLRTMADFQNYRKRVLDEKKSVEERANEKFVLALLPVLDNFERGLQSASNGATLEMVLDGMRAIDRQLKSVLESQKVTRIESIGRPFDPDLHEAIAAVESDEAEGTVLDEIESGYRLGEKVIRPARVRVAKKP